MRMGLLPIVLNLVFIFDQIYMILYHILMWQILQRK